MVPQMQHFSLDFLVRSEPDGLKRAGLFRGYVGSQGGIFPAPPYWDTSHDRQWKWKKQTSLSWILFKESFPPATNTLSFWERMSGIENYPGHKHAMKWCIHGFLTVGVRCSDDDFWLLMWGVDFCPNVCVRRQAFEACSKKGRFTVNNQGLYPPWN